MSRLEDYATKYQTVRMERRHGILQMTLHTEGGPLRWGFLPHRELPEAFYDVGVRLKGSELQNACGLLYLQRCHPLQEAHDSRDGRLAGTNGSAE